MDIIRESKGVDGEKDYNEFYQAVVYLFEHSFPSFTSHVELGNHYSARMLNFLDLSRLYGFVGGGRRGP